MPLLLYGITQGPVPALSNPEGVGGQPIRCLDVAGLGVYVSDFDGEQVIARRRNLADFQRTVTELGSGDGVLPASFGLLATDEQQIRDIIERNAGVIREQLSSVRGRVEYTIRLRWNGENLFAWFVECYPSLRALRDRYLGGGRNPTHDERLHLGQSFERLLVAERAKATETVLADLGPVIADWREMPLGNEQTFCALALLVARGQEAALDEAVAKTAARFDDNHVVELLGPWPPYSFAELKLE